MDLEVASDPVFSEHPGAGANGHVSTSPAAEVSPAPRAGLARVLDTTRPAPTRFSSKRLMSGANNAPRLANYGLAPRRFAVLPRAAAKLPADQIQKKEERETRIARGVRRALWLIALATLVNATVAALQWHELHKALGPVRQAASAENTRLAVQP